MRGHFLLWLATICLVGGSSNKKPSPSTSATEIIVSLSGHNDLLLNIIKLRKYMKPLGDSVLYILSHPVDGEERGFQDRYNEYFARAPIISTAYILKRLFHVHEWQQGTVLSALALAAAYHRDAQNGDKQGTMAALHILSEQCANKVPLACEYCSAFVEEHLIRSQGLSLTLKEILAPIPCHLLTDSIAYVTRMLVGRRYSLFEYLSAFEALLMLAAFGEGKESCKGVRLALETILTAINDALLKSQYYFRGLSRWISTSTLEASPLALRLYLADQLNLVCDEKGEEPKWLCVISQRWTKPTMSLEAYLKLVKSQPQRAFAKMLHVDCDSDPNFYDERVEMLLRAVQFTLDSSPETWADAVKEYRTLWLSLAVCPL